jgi:hypothetical protein
MAGDVVDLAQRKRERVMAASQHPALRWVADSAFYVAHRKDGGRAACGMEGSLMLAPPGVPACTECFPLAERTTSTA